MPNITMERFAKVIHAAERAFETLQQVKALALTRHDLALNAEYNEAEKLMYAGGVDDLRRAAEIFKSLYDATVENMRELVLPWEEYTDVVAERKHFEVRGPRIIYGRLAMRASRARHRDPSPSPSEHSSPINTETDDSNLNPDRAEYERLRDLRLAEQEETARKRRAKVVPSSEL
jgi:hypothetical protein